MNNFDTPRLLIRPLLTGDKAFFCRQFTNEKVMIFTGGPLTPEAATKQFQRSLRANKQAIKGDKKSVLTWTIVCKKTKKLLGTQTLSFLTLPYNKAIMSNAKTIEIKQAELGIILSMKAQRKGFAKEALWALIEFSFNHLKLDKINAFYHKSNTPSGKLFLNLNFIGPTEQHPSLTEHEYIYVNIEHDKYLKI